MAINVSEMSFPTATTTAWEREPIDLPFAFLTYMLHSTGVCLLINFLKIQAAQKTRTWLYVRNEARRTRIKT